mmetsp:Transcript_39458/g.72795  ORF Transcript_39458/g.72795 Transcript_39458/m.72795 type:complete len:85 (-) Transcript_39458:47-301(-)
MHFLRIGCSTDRHANATALFHAMSGEIGTNLAVPTTAKELSAPRAPLFADPSLVHMRYATGDRWSQRIGNCRHRGRKRRGTRTL